MIMRIGDDKKRRAQAGVERGKNTSAQFPDVIFRN